MKSLIVILFFSLFSNGTPATTTSSVNGCEYFELVDQPTSNGKACCFTFATIPGLTVNVTYIKSSSWQFPGPTKKVDEETGIFTVCIPNGYSGFQLSAPEVNAVCTQANMCFSSFLE